MTSLNDDMPLDNRQVIEVDISDEDFLKIAKMAHERDITFNQMVEIVLQAEFDRRQGAQNV